MLKLSYIISSVSNLKAILLAAAVSSIIGCSTISDNASPLSGGNFYTEEFPEVAEDTLAINTAQDLFRIGDIADITFFNVEELSNTYPVDREGNINFPLIGTQKVSGLSTLDLQKKLVSAYSVNYLQSPNIIVKREATLLGKIVVDGSVSNPGVFELFKPVALSEAIALSGGLAETANSKEVFIVREIEGNKKVRVVNLKEIRRSGATDPQIYPQDIVYVQDNTGKVAFDEFLKVVPLLSTILLLERR